ncbi:MAG: zinc ABC transporter substrate-binding protein [Cytophagaceae bacterium]|nr:zinc ABC transporter substrate-binding protein [Cytophagaceae bacterium]
MNSKHYIAVLLLAFAFFSCQRERKEFHDNGKFRIVTTTGMLADGVKLLVGDQAEVISLMGTGVDPHLYKATAHDLSLLQNADLILYNGLHLEGKMSEIFDKLKRRKHVLAIADGLPKERLRKTGAKTYDPHIWFDVSLWKQGWLYVAEELRKDSTLAVGIEQNHNAFFKGLDSLHSWSMQQLQTIPQSSRVLVTAHDAFGYFGRAYHIEVLGLQGISTVSDFGLKDISELVNRVVASKVKAVFIETSVSSKAIEAVVEGCKAQGHDIHIGGALYSDAMGKQGTAEGTYNGMVRANVIKIVNGLK